MFKLEFDREYLWQWDLNQRLILTDVRVGVEVHFSHPFIDDLEEALPVYTYLDNDIVCVDIPNILLQVSGYFNAYVYTCFESDRENEAHTKMSISVEIKERKKPADYLYEETDKIVSYAVLEKRINELMQKDNVLSSEIKNLKENGTGGSGATPEQLAQIEQNKNDIGQLYSEINDMGQRIIYAVEKKESVLYDFTENVNSGSSVNAIVVNDNPITFADIKTVTVCHPYASKKSFSVFIVSLNNGTLSVLERYDITPTESLLSHTVDIDYSVGENETVYIGVYSAENNCISLNFDDDYHPTRKGYVVFTEVDGEWSVYAENRHYVSRTKVELVSYIRHNYAEKTELENVETIVNALKGNYSLGEFVFSSEHPCSADMTFIKNQLVRFTPSDSGSGYAFFLNVDMENKTITLSDTKNHDLGHVNSIDYCEKNDCLIFGNGGSEYGTNGKIYILPNVSEKTTFSLSDCIEIQNVDGYGDKYNVVWGEDNDEQFNIAYLITNDNKNVRKLLLGKTDNTFNGTCILLEEYSQDDGLEVNQGTKFYKNRLYYNVGHSGIRVVCSTLEKEKVNSLEIPYTLYNSDGSKKLSCYGQGIAFKDGYCFVGCNDKIRVFKI